MQHSKLYALIIIGLFVAALAIASYYSVTRGIRGLRAQFHLTQWLLYAIVAVFAFGLFQGIGVGGAGFFGRETALQGTDIVAKVAGQNITQADIERQLGAYKQYGIEGDQLKQFAQNVIRQEIQSALLDEAARRAGVTVSDTELHDKLINEFWPNNKITTYEGYRKLVKRQWGYSPAEFESVLRSDLRREKYQRLLVDAQVVTPAQARDVFMKEKDIVTADYFLIETSGLMTAIPEPKPAEIEAVYQRDIAKYQFGERRALKVLSARPASYQNASKASDKELQDYFNKNQKDYAIPADQRRASHLLLLLSKDAPPGAEDKVRAQAESYAAEARAGKPFAALASLHSEDPGSKDKGGDLGWFGKGRMVPEFDKAVFEDAKKKNDIIGPFKTQFGYHIVMLTGVGPGTRDFAEVRPQLEMKYKNTPAMIASFKKRADALKPKLQAAKSVAELQKLADDNELKIKDTGVQPIEKTGYIPDVGSDPELMEKIFKAKSGDIIVQEMKDGGAVAVVVTGILPAGPKPLESVRYLISSQLRSDLAMTQAKAKAGALTAALAKGGTLKDAAEKAGLAKKAENNQPAEEVKSLTLNASQKNAAEFPDEPGLRDQLLAAGNGQVLGPLELKRGALVAKLTDRKHPDPAELPKAQGEIIARLKSEKAEPVRRHELDALRIELTKNHQLIENDELIKKQYTGKPQGMPPGMPEEMPTY